MKRLVFYIKKISALTHQLKKFNSPFHKRRSRNRFVDITTNEYQLEWFELAHPRIARSIVSIRFVQTRHSPIIHRAIEFTANFHGGNLTQQPFCLDFSVSAACHEFRLSNYEDEPSASSSCLTLLSLSLSSKWVSTWGFRCLETLLPVRLQGAASHRYVPTLPSTHCFTSWLCVQSRVSLYNPFASPMLTTLKTVGKWNGTTRGYNELKRFVEYFANESLLFLLFFFF